MDRSKSSVFLDTCFFAGFGIIMQRNFPNNAYEIDYEFEKLNLEHWLRSEYMHIS